MQAPRPSPQCWRLSRIQERLALRPHPASNEQLTPSMTELATDAKRNSATQAVFIEDVRSLWTSVENGDTRAEVARANRYIRGEGVPQSCAQARVLLEA